MNALQQCLTPGTRLVGFHKADGAGTEVPKGVRGESTSIKGFINRDLEVQVRVRLRQPKQIEMAIIYNR